MSDIKQVTMVGENKEGVEKVLIVECDSQSAEGKEVVRFPNYNVAVSLIDLLDVIDFLKYHQ